MTRERNEKGQYLPIHSRRYSRLYRVWCAMKERCNNPHNKRYDRYGGRGIRVCDEWKEFATFQKWSEENGYSDNLTIDRIDNSGNYEPSNCRWVTQKEQNRNYSRNHNITYHGETHCITDWEAITGIKRGTILWRIKSGKPLDEVFKTEDGRSTRWQKQNQFLKR